MLKIMSWDFETGLVGLRRILVPAFSSFALGSISAVKSPRSTPFCQEQRPVSMEIGVGRDFLPHAQTLPAQAGSALATRPVSARGYLRGRVGVAGPQWL